MTPMIDIVFQLLAFFITTLKIVTLEGDFNIKMPAPTPAQGASVDEQLPVTMTLRLRSNDTGDLAAIEFEGENSFRSFKELNQFLITLLGSDSGPGSMRESSEIELDCDYNLRYEYTIEAISAVSGYLTPDGQTVKLIDKIGFSPPRE